jgi:hypothetical protein
MRRGLFATLAALATALAWAGTAGAGCFATVGIAPLPDAVAAGETWTVDLRVMQHGITPLEGATPTVILTNQATGEERRFGAKPTSEIGRYRVEAAFPREGTWSVAVHDGFPEPQCAQTHTFGSYPIAPSAGPSEPPPSAAAGEGFPLWAVWVGLGSIAAALVAWLVVRAGQDARRRRATA